MITEGKYQPVSGIKNLVKEYTESTYKIDRYYRYFYFYFDKLEDTTQFEKIRELVENIYTNEYLNRITVNWNNELADVDGETGLTLQRDFFARHINYSKDNKTDVEVQQELGIGRTSFYKMKKQALGYLGFYFYEIVVPQAKDKRFKPSLGVEEE